MKFSKEIKKTLTVVACTAIILGAFAPIVSKAEESILKPNTTSEETPDYKMVEYTLDAENFVSTSDVVRTENGFSGKLNLHATSYQLFDEMYKKFIYVDKNNSSKKLKYKVMFSKDKSFPKITYKINFPENVSIDESKISFVSKINTITRVDKTVTKEVHQTTVTLDILLGSWNDYLGFFSLYAKDQDIEVWDTNTSDKLDKYIDISIPYNVEGDNAASISSGTCDLYYYYLKFIELKLADIDTTEVTRDLTTNSSDKIY